MVCVRAAIAALAGVQCRPFSVECGVRPIVGIVNLCNVPFFATSGGRDAIVVPINYGDSAEVVMDMSDGIMGYGRVILGSMGNVAGPETSGVSVSPGVRLALCSSNRDRITLGSIVIWRSAVCFFDLVRPDRWFARHGEQCSSYQWMWVGCEMSWEAGSQSRIYTLLSR
jgi:hypothetical protein